MDFDESTIEDYERHEVNSYLFGRLLKFRLDNKGIMAEDLLRVKENVINCSAKNTDQFSYHPPVKYRSEGGVEWGDEREVNGDKRVLVEFA